MRPSFALLVLCLLSALGWAAPPRPNVVLILADDLGYGDLGCYGQKRIRTPHLDRMAAEGLRFTNFYAGSTVCAPSRCVLMTGLHTGHCYIRGNAKLNLRPEDVTLARALHDSGYRTGLVGKWGLGHEGSTGVPTRQGFDAFFGYLDQHHAHNYYPTFLHRNEERVVLKNEVPGEGDFGTGVATKKVEYSHDLLAEEALKFLEARTGDQPFFLYLALTTPHANNEAKKEGMEVPDLGEYAATDWPAPQKGHAAMIARMDRDIGRVFARLKSLGLDEKTLVLFSSDNGPHREGGNDPDFNDSNGPLRGIKRDMADGGIRVPFLARWPGRITPGTTDQVAWSADLFPTLAELAGAETPANLDGLSLVPTLLGEPGQKQPDLLYWEFYEGRGARAARRGKWKAICKPFQGEVQLYDLATDIGEARNVAAEHPEIVADLKARMDNAHVPSPDWKFKP